MINLPDLADQLNQYGLINKSFMDMTKPEIELMISAVFSCPDDSVPVTGWDNPRVDNGNLVIPSGSHPKYHWWTAEGQSIYETLIEIGAPWEVARKHLSSNMTEEAYLKDLVPF